MTPEATNHLSEEALDDVLIGLGSVESQAHLAVCPECRVQVETFRGDVNLFNAASMEWSKGRPRRPVPVRPAGRIPAAFVGWAVSAAALAAMLVGVWRHQSPSPPGEANTVQPRLTDSQAQIVEDNQLLQAVNAAINQDEASPIDEYKILESPHTRSKAHSNKRMK
jgi:hypothetical protein